MPGNAPDESMKVKACWFNFFLEDWTRSKALDVKVVVVALARRRKEEEEVTRRRTRRATGVRWVRREGLCEVIVSDLLTD